MKKVFSMRVEESLVKALKHIAIDLNKSSGAVLEEAIQDLLRKYQTKTQAKKKP